MNDAFGREISIGDEVVTFSDSGRKIWLGTVTKIHKTSVTISSKIINGHNLIGLKKIVHHTRAVKTFYQEGFLKS